MSVVVPFGIRTPGPLVISTDVDDQLLATLKEWSPTYLRLYHDDRGLSFNPARPRTYANTFEGFEFLDHQLPAIVATTAQMTSTIGGSNRTYEGTWTSLVASVVRGKRPAATRYLAAMYEGVAREIVLQKAGGGPIDDLRFQRMYNEVVPDATGQGRYILAAVSQYQVSTDVVVQSYGGPDVPDAETYLDEATVVEVDIDVLGSEIQIGGSS
jgi:hypothetical protein